jgi:hypothetical protein
MRLPILIVLLLVVLHIPASSPQQLIPPEKLDKNKEYVCTKWTDSANYSQKRLSVCLQWEVKEKPFHRRII